MTRALAPGTERSGLLTVPRAERPFFGIPHASGNVATPDPSGFGDGFPTGRRMETLYDVLGVDPDADPEAIRRAYREQVKRHHPDVDGDAGEFRRLTTARDVLLDRESRRRYDALGHRRYAVRHLDDDEWPVEAPRAARRRSNARRRAGSRSRRTRPGRGTRTRNRRRGRRRRSSGPVDAAVALGTYRSVLVRAGLALLALLCLAVVLSALSL